MTTERLWSPEWAVLDSEEVRRLIRAERCETCAAMPGQPCMSKRRTTLWNYYHNARMVAAMKTFNLERQRAAP